MIDCPHGLPGKGLMVHALNWITVMAPYEKWIAKSIPLFDVGEVLTPKEVPLRTVPLRTAPLRNRAPSNRAPSALDVSVPLCCGSSR
jgi:hypothetical protein